MSERRMANWYMVASGCPQGFQSYQEARDEQNAEGGSIFALVPLDELERMERERAEMLEALHDSLGALKSVQEYASSEMVDGQIDDLVDIIARVEGRTE